MKFSIDRASLLRSLSHVQSAVERRNTIPILANVLLRAEGNSLSLSTTDMDLEIDETVAATVEEAGDTTAPATTLYDIVRKLPDETVIDITTNEANTQMTVKAGKSQFKLGCLPTADFPQLAADDMNVTFDLAADELRSLIDKTRFAISTEETRYYLNGIYIHAHQAEGVSLLRAVATDGHRLARFEMALPDGAENMPSVIIPRKTVLELRKLIDEAADTIRITLSDTKVRFSFDHIVLTSKLIDGTFPDYERVIPANNDKTLELDPKMLAAAVDRVSTISTEKTRAIKLELNGQTLVLSANSPDSGSASEELEVKFENEPLEIGFNSRYLMDIAQQIEGKGARLTMADGSTATIIQDLGDQSSLYVLMPMRV
ncbi:MAG: DNA polymerase III subunit beta [Rickettsiales bacterium]|nr:DNA polymerase III subunit beta [Rickettsiales bacterium]